MRRRTTHLVAAMAGALLAVFAGGVALATIPGNDGTIQGCYLKVGGILRVVDTGKGEKCLDRLEAPISWSQKGPKGDTGPAGAQGPPGSPGPKGEPGAKSEPGAGLTRLEDLNGLPCTPGDGLTGRVSVDVVNQTTRSSDINLKCINVNVRTLSIDLVAADLAAQSAVLSARVAVEPLHTTTGAGVCAFGAPCSWDVGVSTEQQTATAEPLSSGTRFVEWRAGPCAGSTAPTCTFTIQNDITLVAAFGVKLN